MINKPKFKPMSLADLLALPPETGEQGYRRGYCDGYIIALQDIAGDQPVNNQLRDFAERDLFDWRKRTNAQKELPPTAPDRG